jgi:hypothetical protein
VKIITIMFVLLTTILVEIGYCYESKPLVMGPCNLVELLPEPAKSLHKTIADSLHSEQVRLINMENISYNSAISIITLAMEEYYHRELSYPKSSADLVASGYLDSGFEALQYKICDYDVNHEPENSDIMIFYIPQPIGMTELSPVPGKNCAFTRFCYNEYLLAVKSSDYPFEQRLTYPKWFTPYSSLGFEPVFYVSQSNPGASECAGC